MTAVLLKQDTLTPRLFTVEEYMELAEKVLGREERTELLYGIVYTTPPIGPTHSYRNSVLCDQLRMVFGDDHYVMQQQPLRLGDSLPQPDAAVVRKTVPGYDLEHPRNAILVAEVSQSSLAFDRGEKLQLYATNGIPEYWIVNLVEGCLEVYTDPTQTPTTRYKTIRILYPGDTISPLARPDQSIAVADLLPTPDPG